MRHSLNADETALVVFSDAYRLSATVRLDHPASGVVDCSASLLFDADAAGSHGYAVRLREHNGVPYVGVLRIGPDTTTVLGETLQGLTLGRNHAVVVDVDGPVLRVALDGTALLECADADRTHGDHLAFRVTGSTAAAGSIDVETVTATHAERPQRIDTFPAATPTDGEPIARLVSATSRLDLVPAVSGADTSYRLQQSLRDADGSWSPAVDVGEWWLASGPHIQLRDVRGTADLSQVRLDRVQHDDKTSVTVAASAMGYADVTLTLILDGDLPRLRLRARPERPGQHVALFHAFEPLRPDEIVEVACGPLQHHRMVRGDLLPASEVTTPFALVEHEPERPLTWGVGVPAARLDPADEDERDAGNQPFAVGLCGPDGRVRPTVCLPAPGRRAWVGPGDSVDAEVVVVMRGTDLDRAYDDLLRTEYGYRAYREPLFGQSLTDTVVNLTDLVAIDPDAGDAGDFAASPSGWWGRAKNFIDIENDQTVRATTSGVLLSASYLFDDPDLYDRRARPLLEFQLSRNSYGWTPVPGSTVYGDATRDRLCSTPVGIASLAALHDLTGRRSPGIAALAREPAGADDDYWMKHAPFMPALHRYRLDRDPADLRRAVEVADDYIATRIERPPSTPVDPHEFAVHYTADWIGLLELFAETGDARHLRAAHREARRFATQTFVRPIPDGTVRLPVGATVHDRGIDLGRWWDPVRLPTYPRTDLPATEAPAWAASICGMGLEAVTTLRHSGPTMNPGWAAPMLRVAALVGDDLLADVAHNSIVGRFSNYPGYYYRQRNVAVLQPDFPLVGPFDTSTLYYHHAPGQLGLVLDYLFAEHEVRSGGRVVFPAAFEENFVWFRFRTFGHRPGRFFDIDEVWPWMPRQAVRVDNAAVSWIGGVRDHDTFVVSIVNSSPRPQTVRVGFGDRITGLRADHPVVVHRTEGAVRRHLDDGTVSIQLAAFGHVGLELRDVGPLEVRLDRRRDAPPADPLPTATSTSYCFSDGEDGFAVRGLLLARPDRPGHDAFVQSTCAVPATLQVRRDDDAVWESLLKASHPAEWTVPVPAGVRLHYRVVSGATQSREYTLTADSEDGR